MYYYTCPQFALAILYGNSNSSTLISQANVIMYCWRVKWKCASSISFGHFQAWAKLFCFLCKMPNNPFVTVAPLWMLSSTSYV